MDSPTDLLRTARERFDARDYHGAALLLASAIQAGRAYADAHYLLGVCYALTERREQALASFDAALALNPRYVEAHLTRSVVLSDLGRGAEAAEALAQAHDLGKPDASGMPVVVANRLANMHADLGRAYREAALFGEAVAQYERALEMRPQFADVQLELARTFLEAGRPDDASRILDGSLAARPDWLDAMLLRGLAAYLAGSLEQAKSVWDDAATRHPDEPRLETYRSMLARRLDAGESR